jgi:hypothetical protein
MEPIPAPLLSTLELLQLQPAERDIFVSVSAPNQPVKPPSGAVAPPTLAAAMPPTQTAVVAAAPTAPALAWRYFGAMTTPEGQPLTLLARGDATLSVQPGTALDQGYVVQSISREAVRLVYPPLGTEVELPISSPVPAR